MGLFDKKYCDICGEKIGLMGNRKLEDGNCCKDCAAKLSPWFSDRRSSTVADIRAQLSDREANQQKVQQFTVTRQFNGSYRNVYIDDTRGWFAVAPAMNVNSNPDILELSQVTSCILDIDEDKDEETYTDKDGNRQSYNPKRYKYSYSFRIRLSVSSPWFEDMSFDLSGSHIDNEEQQKLAQLEETGYAIVEALTGRPAVRQASVCTRHAIAGENVILSTLKTVIGQSQQRPVQNAAAPQGTISVSCSNCGWNHRHLDFVPRFCPMCGVLLKK